MRPAHTQFQKPRSTALQIQKAKEYLQDKESATEIKILEARPYEDNLLVGGWFVDKAGQKYGFELRFGELGALVSKTRINVKLQNIVATGDIGHTLDIERLTMKLPNTIYEPEQFPGAIYHAKELEGASILIFASGKVVFAGLKRQELLEVGKRVLADLARIV